MSKVDTKCVSKACKGCFYLNLGGDLSCDFFLVTGRRRGCHAGDGCKEYTPKKRDHAARLGKEEKIDNGRPETTDRIKNGPKKRNRPSTKLDEEKTMELYRKGCNDREIAIRLGMSKTGIQNWRKRNGLSAIAPQKRIDGHEEQVMNLYQQGLSDSAIGRAVGFSESAVRRWRLRRGFPATHQQGWPTK